MLVLSRKTGERILLGDDVTITVIRVGPNAVRLGFEAPQHLNIVREELCVDVELPKSFETAEPRSDDFAAAG